jgi:hypothetical protein
VVSGAFGPTAAVAIDAASFALSAAGACLIRLRNQPGPAPGARRAHPGQELLAGARFLWQHPVLRALTAALTLFIFLTYGLTDVLVYYLRHDLGRSYATVGTVLAIAAVGPLGGSMRTHLDRGPLRRRPCVRSRRGGLPADRGGRAVHANPPANARARI